MADEASKTPIPQPKKEDHEDVSWALSTADATWNRGDRADALKWLRRAAESASEAEQDDRALELAKAAAELASQLDVKPGMGGARAAPPVARMPLSAPPPPPAPSAPRSMPPPLPAAPSRPSKPPALPTGKASSLTTTMVSTPPATPPTPAPAKVAPPSNVTTTGAPPKVAPPAPGASSPPPAKGSAPASPKVEVRKAPIHTPAPRPAVVVKPAAKPADAKPADAKPVTPKPAEVRPTAAELERASRLAAMGRSAGEDSAVTWSGANDRPSEPETPQSKRGVNGNADGRVDTPRAVPATLSEKPPGTPSVGRFGPPTTRFSTSATSEEIDGWPTAALAGGDLPDDFHDEHKTRIDAPAYRDADEDAYDGSAIVPPKPKTGDVRPTQAVRVVVWRAADGVHVAPHGTTISAISVDAMLVALDPTADLFSWLKGK